MKDDLTWIELSEKNFIKNIKTVRLLVGNKVILSPCVKGNAYGHGIIETAKILSCNGADWFSVYNICEGILLRKNKINLPIIILGYVNPKEASKVITQNLRVIIYDYKLAKALSCEAVKKKKQATVHIKIDTGMNRQGIKLEDLEKFVTRVKALPNINIEGIATHFANSDELSKRKFYFDQKKKLEKAIKICQKIIDNNFLIHCANSAAILTDSSAFYDLARPGISIYGYYPSEEVKKICYKKNIILSPVLSFYTKIIQIKKINRGECVSYGSTFKAKRNTKIAVLPVGYYDGISRSLSNIGYVLIHGAKAKIIGIITMNMIIVDITNIKNVQVGDKVVIIGKQGKSKITADNIAKLTETINYEVLTNLKENIERIIV